MEWLFLSETDSTNRVALELARQGAGHGTAVLAERQTGGRGRLGRQFYSPVGGLYLSLVLRPELSPQELTLLTPLAAVAVCRVVERLCGVRPTIKWVNDLYLEGKKLCGILCQGAGEAAVVGIGMNLRTPEGGFPPELNAVALDASVDREELARAVATEVLALCARLPDTGFLTEYRENNLVLGRQITVRPVTGAPYVARALDLDHRGRLVVEKDEQILTLDSGEVSIGL